MFCALCSGFLAGAALRVARCALLPAPIAYAAILQRVMRATRVLCAYARECGWRWCLLVVGGCAAACCGVLCAVAWLGVLLQRAMCNARL